MGKITEFSVISSVDVIVPANVWLTILFCAFPIIPGGMAFLLIQDNVAPESNMASNGCRYVFPWIALAMMIV